MAFLTQTRPTCGHIPARRPSFIDLVALYRPRRALGRLDETALTDLGIPPQEARAEARKPIWDIPSNWRK